METENNAMKMRVEQLHTEMFRMEMHAEREKMEKSRKRAELLRIQRADMEQADMKRDDMERAERADMEPAQSSCQMRLPKLVVGDDTFSYEAVMVLPYGEVRKETELSIANLKLQQKEREIENLQMSLEEERETTKLWFDLKEIMQHLMS